MKKILLLFLTPFFAFSCIDKDYDLSKIDTDNITIGDETSLFKMPLAILDVKVGDLNDGDLDIQAIFDEVDIWLPTVLPGKADYLDITRLTSDQAYVDTLLSALLLQLETDDQKLEELTDLIWDKYRDEFLPLLPLQSGQTVTEVEFKKVFKQFFRQTQILQDKATELAANYLTDIRIDPLHYDVGKIDVGKEVIDMLGNNLDSKDTVDPKNTLHLYGNIFSMLPVGLDLAPSFTNTNVAFCTSVEPDVEKSLPETQLFKDDLEKIISGTEIIIPITLLKYYPKLGFNADQKIHISLQLKKRGGLSLDI